MDDLATLSVEPLTYWRGDVWRPWGRIDRDVLLIRHVSAPPFGNLPVQEWFRDESINTDVRRQDVSDLVRVR